LVEVDPEPQGEGIGAAAARWVVGESVKRNRETLLQVHRIND
jgi:hypothetical protein